jgi:uncharacterized protein (DUF58 family)
MPDARTALLDPAFVGKLEALRRRLEIRARSGAAGERVARRRGSSAEFEEHRPYAPGDDLRRIDWAAYARTDEPIVKVHRAEEDVVVRLLTDASASMELGAPSKLELARQLAAAMGYLALARGERAELLVAGEGLAAAHPSSRGRAGLPALLRRIDALEARGATNLAVAIEAAVRRASRPGYLLVASDFLDPGPVLGAIARAAAAGHDVAIAHVVAPEELVPPHEGDLVLEDAETGALVEVTIDAAAIEAYAARFEGLCQELRRAAKRAGGAYVRAIAGAPLDDVVRRLVARSVD